MLKHKALWETHFPQISQANEPVLEQLMASANLVRLPDKQQIFYPGSVCENYLLMLEGGVKAQLISENGREVLLYHVQPGDSCVLTTSCLLSGEHYPAEGMTEGDVAAFAISSHAFYRGIEQSAFFREFVFKNFAARLTNVMQRIESIVFDSIDVRLSQSLLAENSTIIHKTHQALSADLGTAREVVSRHLKRFEAYGWVALTRGSIEILDRNALKKLSDATQ
ncbi:MAG: Crp/Fnr family transcriptional regulator [Methylococcales bacterium]|nr:Crp/Fnr family transcriptional regulator [Methylococcales bacterium]